MSSEIFRVLGMCLVAALLSIVLKSKSLEFSVVISVFAGFLAAVILIKSISEPISQFKNLIEEYNLNNQYFKVAVKALGIGYITSFIADTCRDSGQTSLAAKAELAGKVAIFTLSLPLLLSILNIATGLIK
ncbi:MAG: stage III sporulation protein AD [Clostridia bacterium]|nr:stage III sporulation protein AD [Clostridia bacterium]